MHLSCHLCGEYHRNMFYNHYESLEVHFSRSHYICPYDICKSKCYVAFQTENELQAHLNIAHTRKVDQAKVNANALLGFTRADESERHEAAAADLKRDRANKHEK